MAAYQKSTIRRSTQIALGALLLAGAGCGNRAVFDAELSVAQQALGSVTPEVSLTTALCALDNLSLSASTNVFTYDRFTRIRSERAHVAANGSISLDTGALVEGHAVAGGAAQVVDRTEVTGEIVYGAPSNIGRRAKFTAQYMATPAPTPCGCLPDMETLFAAVADVNDNDLLAASPQVGPYFVDGSLDIPDGVVVRMPPGIFWLQHVRIGNNGVLELSVPNTTAQLFVERDLTIASRGRLEVHDGVQEMWVFARNASTTISLARRSATAARIVAPYSDVTIPANTHLLGSAVARNITLERGARVRFHGNEVDLPPTSCQTAF